MLRVERLQWIDAWKGVLILLVVLGHVAGGGCHLATGVTREALRVVYFLIYAFHMSAFFFLVGWMWKERPIAPFVVRRFVRLMLPYFAVGVVSILAYSICGGDRVMSGNFSSNYYTMCVKNNGDVISNLFSLLHGGGWPNGQGFRYNTVLWFLPCMFLTQVTYGIARVMFRGVRGLVLLAGVAFVIMVLLGEMGASYWPWGVNRVPYYLIFVAMGEIAHRLCAGDRVPVVRLSLTVIIAGIFSAAVWLFSYLGIKTGYCAYIIRIVVSLLGIYLSMIMAQTVKGWVLLLLCAAGTYSMTIMLWHKFFVVGAQIKVSFVSAFYQSGMIGACAATIGVTAGSMFVCWFLAKAWEMAVKRLKCCWSEELQS